MATSHGPTGHDDRNYCGGKKHQGVGTCTQPAGWGTSHPGIGRCKLHGGSTGNHGKAAQVEQARRDVVLFGARRDVHPAEALLELVQWTAGEVDYWRARVAEVAAQDDADLTWGVTRTKTGGDDHGTTQEAKPHVAYAMYADAAKRLEAHSVAALRAGVEERAVRVAESVGAQLAAVIRAVLGELGLTAEQEALVGEVVPKHLRAMCQGCHLHYDREHHAATRAKTRAAELEAANEVLW